MRYDIKRGTEIIASQLLLEGTVTEKIMGEEIANVTFSHPSKIEFHIGDKITIYGKDYFLSADPSTVKKNSREFQYTMIFFSIKYALSNWNVFFYDNDGLLTIPEFSIMGTASTCLDIVITNANRADSGWAKGVVDDTEVKNITFSDCNCLEAISKIAEEFKLEYWIDSNKSIHFTERKPVSGYSFEYGKAKGLKDITRSVLEGGTLVTRLHVKGSDKNLPKNYRGGQKNLRIDVPCLEKNIDIYGVKEHTETFSDIYPKRVGTVTAVDPLDHNRFTDADLDFDLNAYNEYGTTVLMNGVAAKIIFQTGQLAGYRIELIEAGGFNSATKTFYLNPVKDEKDMQVPSELLRPAVGDNYIIEDIMMPEIYVLSAESDLKIKGQEYLDQNSKERFQYANESDILYFRNQNINIQLGYTVHFKDEDFNLDDDIRVIGLQKNIQNPYDVKFDLSEVTVVSSIVQSYYEQQEQTHAILNSIKYNAELTRRNYLFGREFHDKVFDGEDYFNAENIKPLSIETKMLSLGSRLQQFGLPGVNFKLQNNNALQNTAGKIAHQTIDPDKIREWNIAANTVSGITNNFNYIYIKCQKSGANANFIVAEAQIKVEQDPDFYHFEVGYLSSVLDGYRKIKTTFGFAQLNPAELSIGRISDPSGNNYIDLLPDRIAIKAKVEFTGDSPAFNQVNNAIQIGGRNLLRSSKGRMPTLWSGGNVVKTVAGINYDKVTGLVYFENAVFENLQVGEEYTISIKYRSEDVPATDFSWYINDENEYKIINSPDTAGKWKVISDTRKIVGNGNVRLHFYVPKGVVTVEWMVLTKGNKGVQDWIPAPEDIIQEIAQAKLEAEGAAKAYSDAQDSLREITALAYADGIVTASENRSILDATNKANAVKLYADAQDQNLQILLKAQLDGVVDDFEASLISTSGENLAAAKAYALAQAEAARIAAEAYADGEIDAEEAARIAQADTNLTNARHYADAQDALLRLQQQSYADGVISASEANAIAVAKAYADQQRIIAEVYADGVVDAEEQARLNQAALNLTTAMNHAQGLVDFVQIGGRNLIRNSGNFNPTPGWNNGIDLNGAPYIIDRNLLYNGSPTLKTILGNGLSHPFIILENKKMYTYSALVYSEEPFEGNYSVPMHYHAGKGPNNEGKIDILKYDTSIPANKWKLIYITFQLTNDADNFRPFFFIGSGSRNFWIAYFKLEKGNKATDWSPAPEDLITNIGEAKSAAESASKDYSDAQDLVKEVTTRAYADGIVTAAEQRSINDATTKAEAAKAYADAQTANLKILIDAQIDGVVDELEANLISTSSANLSAAQLYAQAQANAAKEASIAWADGEISAEEAARIAQADLNLTNARHYAEAQDALLRLQQQAYADNKVSISEAAAIAEAKAFAELKKLESIAWADGIVSAEEQTRINQAILNLNEAKAHSQSLVDNIQIGGRNLVLKSNESSLFHLYGVTGKEEVLTNPSLDSKKYFKISNIVRTIGNLVFFIPFANNPERFSIPMVGIPVVVSFYIRTNSPQILDYSATQTSNNWTKVVLPYIWESGNMHFNLIGDNLQWVEFHSLKIEKGNKATDWTPAPEDVTSAIDIANQNAQVALAQAQNAQATAAATASVTSFLQTTVDNGVVSAGTLQVGDVLGANAGISGVVDRAGKSVRFWAGATYEGKNTANWLVRDDGVQEKWFNGVLIYQEGVINGVYCESSYNLDGQIGKRKTFSPDGKILEEWYNKGVLVYQIGQDGVYHVSDIPESFTYKGLVNCNTNLIQSNLEFLENPIRQMMYQKTNNPTRFELRANKNSYLYKAGQNVYSEGNKQYEGLKNTKSKADSIPNGWYAFEVTGYMLDDGIDSTRRFANVFRTEDGKTVQSGLITVETSGYSFNQF